METVKRTARRWLGSLALALIGSGLGVLARPGQVQAGPTCDHQACNTSTGWCEAVDLSYNCTQVWWNECKSKICLGG